MVRIIQNSDFDFNSLSSIIPISVNSQPTKRIAVAIKAFVDSLSRNNTKRRDLFLVLNESDNAFYKNKLTKLDSFTLDRNPILDPQAFNQTYVEDSLGGGTVLSFTATLERDIKVMLETVCTILEKNTDNKL